MNYVICAFLHFVFATSKLININSESKYDQLVGTGKLPLFVEFTYAEANCEPCKLLLFKSSKIFEGLKTFSESHYPNDVVNFAYVDYKLAPAVFKKVYAFHYS